MTASTSKYSAAKSSASSADPASGKSVLLRTIIGLNRPVAGSVEVFGHDILADE